jgi:hypothetical protein
LSVYVAPFLLAHANAEAINAWSRRRHRHRQPPLRIAFDAADGLPRHSQAADNLPGAAIPGVRVHLRDWQIMRRPLLRRKATVEQDMTSPEVQVTRTVLRHVVSVMAHQAWCSRALSGRAKPRMRSGPEGGVPLLAGELLQVPSQRIVLAHALKPHRFIADHVSITMKSVAAAAGCALSVESAATAWAQRLMPHYSSREGWFPGPPCPRWRGRRALHHRVSRALQVQNESVRLDLRHYVVGGVNASAAIEPEHKGSDCAISSVLAVLRV